MKRIIPVASIVLTGLAAHSVYAEQPQVLSIIVTNI